MTDFETLLVANRGEIACRIIRTARQLGLRTVAVFSDPDRGAPHVHMADAAVRLGSAPARESYLNVERLLAAAHDTAAGAVHPGYGLLSEDAGFARAVEAAGLAWVGPTPGQLELFGAKDEARRVAAAAGVPLIEGTGVLDGVDAALAAADRLGYPVMVKATGGGGGIGMAPCRSPHELCEAFVRVQRAAAASFGPAAVFLERLVGRARHVEVQVFGDGNGRVLALGDRDCTLQRRHQKVIEEAPAPSLPDRVRRTISDSAVALCAHAQYRSAGTVEFVYDAARNEVSFLEVNARLQVEHTVTEEVLGLDLVAWMLRLALGDDSMFDFGALELRSRPPRHAIQARVYAEDPAAGFQPSAGTITEAQLPEGVRVDGWVRTGTEVTSAYDPLLAKVIATGPTRDAARRRLADALARTRIAGIRTNLGLLGAALAHPAFTAVTHTTATLDAVADPAPRIDVLRAGTLTTVQDWPGRRGLWHVGVPPSGPMDDRSFRLGNLALGNPPGAPGLECTLEGPALRFSHPATVCLCGATAAATLDGRPVALWTPITVPAGGVLDVGTIAGPGLRSYVLLAGGLDVPAYLGSAATFTLGAFGGHGGRALRPGDVIAPGDAPAAHPPEPVPEADRPAITARWAIGVLEGPHAAPEFFTEADIEAFYATDWEVHFNSARTGVRLIGPRPQWARGDGGEAGLHPSNIHDTPYSVGAVDYTGDLPILLGPDGPSLGGFVCPATVTTGERWKLGQLRPGDRVRFTTPAPGGPGDGGVLHRVAADPGRPAVTYRRSGDDNLLIEYGPMTLDLGLRLRVHALAARVHGENVPGIVDLTPGIRSLQIHFDPDVLTTGTVLSMAESLERELPPTDALEVPSRTVRLPLSWDDPATRLAIERYMAGVRSDAPWCPWNIEFIRRVNGLASVEEVRRTVFDAEYLVLGLGDVYLGAPVATPLDPRHRLVTTKYNPARTWTPENAVGIGGAYLCIYGMEGPGGYQFVGRTTQVWSTYPKAAGPFEPDAPWLLRFFDRISWYPVEADELLELRADLAAGRFAPEIEPGTFALSEYERFLADEADGIAGFRARQTAAFAAEAAAWRAAGEFDPRPEPVALPAIAAPIPAGATLVEAPLSASVWQVDVAPGDSVAAGQRLLTLEAMKMETALESPVDGHVLDVLVRSGDQVVPGAGLIVLDANGNGTAP
ncbi:MAG TPA: 5-oxoprolinase/urea amidolyase family protein [Solirubrobacteraceae bacterium]|nr:5-oxoprolinase/urea amidolyase family protein [Solirubrobacteraceae bacterium]